MCVSVCVRACVRACICVEFPRGLPTKGEGASYPQLGGGLLTMRGGVSTQELATGMGCQTQTPFCDQQEAGTAHARQQFEIAETLIAVNKRVKNRVRAWV